MSYPINYPTPQGANIQMFREGGSTSDWVKPQGASFVWFTLIGAGGAGANTANTGGGSGAVTNFMCPAFLIPDMLSVVVGNGRSNNHGTITEIRYTQKTGAGYQLLFANPGNCYDIATSAAGGAAMAANAFTAMGFFQSIAGQDGATNTAASTTTFLSGGAAATNFPVSNYGYGGSVAVRGYSQLQPIIVGVGGGLNNAGTPAYSGGIGCGGGGATSIGAANVGKGGDGMVVIITW